MRVESSSRSEAACESARTDDDDVWLSSRLLDLARGGGGGMGSGLTCCAAELPVSTSPNEMVSSDAARNGYFPMPPTFIT